ncbi:MULTISPECIES: transcription-repair coupling factor [Caproicibacterium]|uniref:Transcription-repair-coupling factor n=1 Tax=Caproicibacterium argilliputei TaxID=3030016 RepID=A0AA97DA86_9FIRM|nr:transcription-repair coupling factor [Caproicibacterium argilliputei]WOC32302.1 transcription-repair coupling factor [Caproicibacterium argilliputei]
MKFIATALSRLREYQSLLGAVQQNQLPAAVTGLSGIHKANVIYALWVHTGRRAFVIAGEESEANRMVGDLCAQGMRALYYPMRDLTLRKGEAASSHDYERQRLQVLARLQAGECDAVVCCIDGALQYTLPPQAMYARTRQVSSGDTLPPEEAQSLLLRCGYEHAVQVEGPGQFARRGGILDLFPPESHVPVRLEFWGDEVDTLSYFDPQTQRRTDPCERVCISPAAEALTDDPAELAERIRKIASSLRGKNAPSARPTLQEQADLLAENVHLACMDKFLPILYEKPACLLDYCAETDLLFVSETVNVKEKMRTAQFHWNEDIKEYLADGTLCKHLDTYSFAWPDALSFVEKHGAVLLDTFARGSYALPTKLLLNFSARQLSVWGGSTQLLAEDLSVMLHNKWACAVLAGNARSARTTAADLRAAGIDAFYAEDAEEIARGAVAVLPGSLSAGAEWPGSFFGFVTHGRLLQSGKRKKSKRGKNSRPLNSLAELEPGDYVVHESHGIGIYEGIHKIDTHGVIKDYIKIQYAKGDTLYVPVTQLDFVSRYIGPREDAGIRLHKLGGAEWQKTKSHVKRAVRDMAKELIKLYAARMHAKGHAFSADTEMQRDFESRFAFDETDDQLRCVEEIKGDMEREAPMDRLLCGDVGFGKTEVALRAAFKCICDSRQCALLVPTTILAWQHYQTALQRMEGFPIRVELLSRFRTPKQQEQIIKQLRRGEVDLVIGTHRLVSKDVQFRDLGLVIIDEEQRFGVAQKEKLKNLCTNVDVLTLSATPIPRTLNMAMSGIRDMSVLEEAPHDRHPVQTYVIEHDEGILADAVRRELRRGGQIYWLHNDVASITQVGARLKARVPEARVGIGHGKMTEQELSEVWRQLIDHEIDVLVCTTIIETGVDVPNANTLIIDNADRLGLSQLHQIRGRVGRSTRRAYAYFTFTPNKVLSEIAQKRLAAIREFTEFGSGFKIAMRDLEIRGAGNLLGGEQHGHMEAVGYEMYLKLLGDAIAAEKGVAPPQGEECLMDLQLQAHIPESYIGDSNGRIEMYRRIADIRSDEDALDVTDELIDRYGDPPKSVAGLIQISLLRNLAGLCGLNEVKQQQGQLLLYQKKLDMKWISGISARYPQRVLVNAGARPYISLRLQPDEDVLSLLKDLLRPNPQKAG